MGLTGSLEDLGIGDILQILFLSRRSGILSINAPSVEGKIYFHKGMVISATSTLLSGNLIDLLAGKGLLRSDSYETLQKLSEGAKTRKTLYKEIATHLSISVSRLEEMIKERLEKIVFTLFLEEGTFAFELTEDLVDLEDPLQILYTPGLNPQFLAMEGTRLFDERKRDQSRQAQNTSTHCQIPHKSPAPSLSPSTPGESIKATPGLTLLKSMIYELQSPHTNTEITLLILRFASEIMNRAVLLMVKKDHLVGLGQFGVSIEGKDPNRVIREIEIPLSEASIFKEAIDRRIAIKRRLSSLPWNEYFLGTLGGGRPVEAFVAPIMVNQKVVALLYGDNLPEDKPIGDTEGLEIFLFQAGMAMERALLERKLTGKE